MAYHPDGQRAPIVSPFYLQWERFPYLRGPNYVRPMFREHSRQGTFRAQPIERTLPPPMAGLGAEGTIVPWWCWDTPAFKEVHGNCTKIEDVDLRDQCITEQVKLMCPWDKPPAGASSTPPPAAEGKKDEQGQPGQGGNYLASVASFFKDKSGQVDPLKVGLAVLVGAIVLREYKKGNR